MPLFGSSSGNTVGAGKSGADDEERYALDGYKVVALLTVALAVVLPVAAFTLILFWAADRFRRVRVTRLCLAAAAVTVVSVLAAVTNGGLGQLPRWALEGTAALWSAPITWVSTTLKDTLDIELPAPQAHSITTALWMTAPVAAPIGAWLGAGFAEWRRFRRSALADLEGERFHRPRPMGLLDRARARRNRRNMVGSPAVGQRRGEVAVGLGAYGRLVWLSLQHLLRPTVVLGGPRQGKTRWTLSVLGQIAHITRRSGFIVIDYKGDGELPAFWSRVATDTGRPFKHFALADKNGGSYVRPSPGAPDRPAYYDPLRRGNATSRTDMLVNSIPREGDAMAYFRAQYEYVQLVFQVAALTRFDQSAGGFATLLRLLDPDTLLKQAHATDPATGRGLLADHAGLRERVEQLVAGMKRDEVARGGISDAARTLSTHMNGPAAGPFLKPAPAGSEHLNIDLVQAALEGEVVVFSLSTQEYGDLARMLGNLVLLDIQNTIAELRSRLTTWRREQNDDDAPPPWDPSYVELEEFSAAGSQLVLGLLNKAGDVNMRTFLSSQSWHDIVAVDGTGTFASQVLDQAGNVVSFGLNDGKAAQRIAELTPPVTKKFAADLKEYSGGRFSGIKTAANTGEIRPDLVNESPATAGDFQKLAQFEFLWFAKSPQPHITHTFTAGPNRWVEVLRSVPVPPDSGSPRPITDNQPEPGTPGPTAAADQPIPQVSPGVSPPSTGETATPAAAIGEEPSPAWEDWPPPEEAPEPRGFDFDDAVTEAPGPGSSDGAESGSSDADETTGVDVAQDAPTLPSNGDRIVTTPSDSEQNPRHSWEL